MPTATTLERPEVDLRRLINPLPSQAFLLDALYDKEYILFGGAAGPGKSYILRWAAIDFLIACADRGHYDVRVGLFCEDYPSLKDRQVTRIAREFPLWLGDLRESKTEGFAFHLHPDYGSGIIALRNLDDPSKYASAEFAAIFVDELTKNPRQTFDDLRFRKRWPGIDHSPFVAASNPGSIGHAWVKKLWIDRDFSGDDGRLDPNSFLFIPALPEDNPYLPQSYWDTLNSLPTAMRRAMKDGDWSIFAGQVFAEWRDHLHTCKPFPIPKDWTRWVGVDYGYANPFCGLWLARTPDKANVYVYREHYREGLRASEQAQGIRLASAGETIWLYAADPSMWQKREGVSGDSLAQEYANVGVELTQANNNRLAGLSVVREALKWRDLPTGEVVQKPRLQVFDSCRNLIRTLPALPYDNIKTEDVDTDAEDHVYDALRYGLMAERQPRAFSGEIEMFGKTWKARS